MTGPELIDPLKMRSNRSSLFKVADRWQNDPLVAKVHTYDARTNVLRIVERCLALITGFPEKTNAQKMIDEIHNPQASLPSDVVAASV